MTEVYPLKLHENGLYQNFRTAFSTAWEVLLHKHTRTDAAVETWNIANKGDFSDNGFVNIRQLN
jgi:hypothetical protein